MSLEQFTARMEALRRNDCRVLSLDEGLAKLRDGVLPERSVCLTFDDGFFNFSARALPVLRSYGYPATVYLTTFYSGLHIPIFSLACSYLLWKGQDRIRREDPRECHARAARVRELESEARARKFSTVARTALVSETASRAGIDYQEFSSSRILQLMDPAEIEALAPENVAIELHTHRHRTPLDQVLFSNEILENRAWIARVSKTSARHFCYPSGRCRPEFLPWLEKLGVVSATTCDPGLATRSHHPLLLPRLVDTSGLSEVEFESWLAGVGAILPRRTRIAA